MYRPRRVRSVLTTSVNILPYRPPARLIRAKYNSFDLQKASVVQFNASYDIKSLGVLRMTSKDKYHVTPQSTPMSSDDEMETSFTSYKPKTVKGMSYPMYGACADSSDTEFPRSEDGPKSKGRRQRRRVPRIRAR